MTNFLIPVVILIILVGAIILSIAASRRKKKERIDRLHSNWGKVKGSWNQFYFSQIERYFLHKTSPPDTFHVISDRTCNDLNFKDLFQYIDRTSSGIGQQYLYFKLRTIQSIKCLRKSKKLSQLFLENESFRIQTQIQLSELDSFALEGLLHRKPPKKPALFWLAYVLSSLSITFLILGILGKPIFFLLLLPIFMINFLLHYRNKSEVESYLNGIVQLRKTNLTAKQISRHPSIQSHFENLDFLRDLDTVNRKTTILGFNQKLNNEYLLLTWYVVELFKIQFNLEYILFIRFLGAIDNNKAEIDQLFQFIGEVDVAISTASLMTGEPTTCEPTFSSDGSIFAQAITHPLIDSCIPNDIRLKQHESLLLTGSNMSGKTTFIKAFAINSWLAQTLYLCFAQAYKAPFFKLYSSIQINDDLLEGKSYYLVEVLTIKELIDKSANSTPCLFVLDELFKGTNTVERIAASQAVLTYLGQHHKVIVSTHDIELVELLSQHNFAQFHFTENVIDDKLQFDHQLKVGPLKTRNAIKILELYGFPKEIIKSAQRNANY